MIDGLDPEYLELCPAPRLEELAKAGNRLNVRCVGNQQKWDTFVKGRSGGNGRVVGLPEQVVVVFAAGRGLSFHLTSLDQDPFPSPVEDVIWRTSTGVTLPRAL